VNHPSDKHSELHALLSKLMDGKLNSAEATRLNELLRGDPEACDLYLNHLTLHAQLERELGGALPAVALVPEQSDGNIIPLFRPALPFGKEIKRRFLHPWPLALAASFALLAMLAAFMLLNQTSASAAELVRHALKTHAVAPDRCYRVEIKLDPALQKTNQAPSSETRLWTRGDRCWIETRSDKQTVAWGHDEQGQVWFALSPKTGVRFDPAEARQRLAWMEQFRQMRGLQGPTEFAKCFDRLSLACDLCSIKVETLLNATLADFDLRRESNGADNNLIHAELKPGRTNLYCREVSLEVDAPSGVLQKLVVHRLHNGQPAGTVTFTLVESSEQTDASYTLAGHLAADAVIYDRGSGPMKRGPMLAQFLKVLWGEAITD
jgi:hypothetical protein